MSGYNRMKMLDQLKGKMHENMTAKVKSTKRKIKLRQFAKVQYIDHTLQMMLKGRKQTQGIKRQQTKSYNYFQPDVDIVETLKLPVFEMKQKPYDDSEVIKPKANALAIKDNIKENLKLK